MTVSLDVPETEDGFHFKGKVAAMVLERAPFPRVTPLAAVRLAVRERLAHLRDLKIQSRDDA